MGTEAYLRVGIDGTGAVTGTRIVKRNLDEIYNSAALTDKQVNTLNKTLSAIGTTSNGTRVIKRDLDDIGSSAGSFSKMLDSIEDRLIRVGISTAVFMAIGRSIGTIKAIAQDTLSYLGQIETSTLGIASSFLVSGSFVNTISGKVVSNQQSMVASLAMSKDIIEQLKVANMQTIATLDQLIVAYQVTLPVAMAKGFNKDQVMDFTLAMVQAAGAIGLPFDQMAEETRSLLTGTINPRTSRIATVLGLRNEDIAEYKGNAKGLFDFLMDRLEGFRIAGLESQKTWAGLWSNVKDISKQGSSMAFSGMFEGIKAELTTIMGQIVTIDNETKKITWNPAFVAGAEQAGESITRFFHMFVTGARWVAEHINQIGQLVAAYTAYKIVNLASVQIQKMVADNFIKTAMAETKHLESIVVTTQAEANLARTRAINAAARLAETEVTRASMVVDLASHNLKAQDAQTNVALAASTVAVTESKLAEAIAKKASNAATIESLVEQRAQILSQTQTAMTTQQLTIAETELAVARRQTAGLSTSVVTKEAQLTAARTTHTAAIQKQVIANDGLLASQRAMAVSNQQVLVATVASNAALVASTAAATAAANALYMASFEGRVLAGVTAGLKTAMGLLGGEIGLIIIAIGSLTYAWIKLNEAEERNNSLKQKRIQQGGVGAQLEELSERQKLLQDLIKEENRKSNPILAAATEEQERQNQLSITTNILLKEKSELVRRIGEYENNLANGYKGNTSKYEADKANLFGVNQRLERHVQISNELKKVNDEIAKRQTYTPNSPKPETSTTTINDMKKLDNAILQYIKSREALELAGEQNRAKSQIDSLKSQYDQNLVTIRDYYTKKKEIEQSLIDGEIGKNNEVISTLKDSSIFKVEGMDEAASHTAVWFETMAKLKDAQTKGIDLTAKRSLIEVQAANDITGALKKQENSYLSLNVEVLKLIGNTKQAELAQLDLAMKPAIEKAETEVAYTKSGSAEEIAAKRHLDNLNIKKSITTELINLTEIHRVKQAAADLEAATGNAFAAAAITDLMELEKMRVERQSAGLILMRQATMEAQRYNDILVAQESAYSKIIGYADKAYELKAGLIKLEVRRMRDAGVAEVAIMDWVSQETIRNYIERARANDGFNEGVIAGFKEIELNLITWGETAYRITQGTYEAMASSFSTIFMDAWNGDLKKAGEYMQSFAQSVLKIFFDMIAQMIAQWIMMKTIMGASSILGSIAGATVGGGAGGAAGSVPGGEAVPAVSSAFAHTGGTYSDGLIHKQVSSSVFINAPRYHKGLMPDEFPAILQKTEGVFTAGQMKALGRGLEARTAAPAGGSPSVSVNVPISGDFGGSKKMSSELRSEVEATVERVVRRYA